MSKKKNPPALDRARVGGVFHEPATTLGALDVDTTAALLAAAADITLVLDEAGTIVDIGFGSETLASELGPVWIGRLWLDVVAPESRAKVSALLGEAGPGAMRWRQVNHPMPSGADLPLQYATRRVPSPQGPRLIAFGRDLRVNAALQQRLIEAQQSMERDYARFRQAELRYRHLFQVAGEAVLVVDAGSGKVVEANPAAALLFNLPAERLVGQTFPLGLAPHAARSVAALLTTVRRSGRADPVMVELEQAGTVVSMSATLFHQDQNHLLLIRTVRADGQPQGQAPSANPEGALLLQLARGAPDGLVVTDLEGVVLATNAEFAALCQGAGTDSLRGQSLERWLGRPGVDLAVLVSNLRQRGAVKLFATTLRGEFGISTEVEISAVMLALADPPVLGFTIRDVGRRLAGEGKAPDSLPRSVNQLTELVGRVPMKEIVGETTDLIEKRCIEAALELTRDNRASAAEILGLSRQSLYVKLRRYGLGDLGGVTDAP